MIFCFAFHLHDMSKSLYRANLVCIEAIASQACIILKFGAMSS